MQHLLTVICNEFKELGGTKDIDPNPDVMIRLPFADGVDDYLHRPFLVRWAADTPAQAKVAMSNSHSAYNPCMFCDIDGEHDEGAIRLAGYDKAVMQQRIVPPRSQARQRYAKDIRRTTSDGLLELANQFEQGNPPEHAVLNGACRIPQILDYFDYHNGFPIPIYHKMVLGVVKNFFVMVMDAKSNCEDTQHMYIPNAAKRSMTWRTEQLIANINVDSKMYDPSSQRSAFHSSHWLRMTETYSVLLLYEAWEGGETSPIFLIWTKIRHAVLMFMKPDSLAFDIEVTNNLTFKRDCPDAAQRCMREAAKLLEIHFPKKKTMTHNLHIITEHLAEQWKRMGVCPAYCGELWLERMINLKKNFAAGIKHDVENVMKKKEICAMKLGEMRSKMKQYEDWVTAPGVDENYGGVTDDTSLDYCFFQGGRTVSEVDAREMVEDGLLQFCRVNYVNVADHLEDADKTTLERFFVASVNGQQVQSQEYTRVHFKESHHVAVVFAEGMYYGSVKYFLKIRSKTGPAGAEVHNRLARVNFYQPIGRRVGGHNLVNIHHVMPNVRDRWCNVEAIKGIVMFGTMGDSEDIDDGERMVLSASHMTH